MTTPNHGPQPERHILRNLIAAGAAVAIGWGALASCAKSAPDSSATTTEQAPPQTEQPPQPTFTEARHVATPEAIDQTVEGFIDKYRTAVQKSLQQKSGPLKLHHASPYGLTFVNNDERLNRQLTIEFSVPAGHRPDVMLQDIPPLDELCCVGIKRESPNHKGDQFIKLAKWPDEGQGAYTTVFSRVQANGGTENEGHFSSLQPDGGHSVSPEDGTLGEPLDPVTLEDIAEWSKTLDELLNEASGRTPS